MSDVQAQLKNLPPEKLRLLVRRLKKQPATGPALPALVPDLERRYEPFPLTDVQQSLFIGRRDIFDLGNVSTHGYGDWPIEELDLDRLNAALRRLIERHEMLRAVVLPAGMQQILREVPPYEVKVQDLRGWPLAEVQAALDATRAELSHQVLPTDRWPLFDIRVSLLNGRRGLLHVSFDTLIGDMWSFRILTTELWRLYADPAAELEPIDMSYRDYVLALKAFEKSEAYQRAEAYWRARLESLPAGPELPVVGNFKSVVKPQFRRRSSILKAESWQRLRSLGARRGYTPSCLLLTAYATVLAMWSKSLRLTVNVTNFNRLPIHPHVRRVIGDFSSLTLLSIDFTQPGPFETRARAVQEQLWQNLEHGHVSAVRLMREIARLEQRAPTALLPVVFTSLLVEEIQVDEAAGELVGETREWPEVADGGNSNISQTPQVWLDHQVVELGGRLIFNWDAVEELFPPGLLDDMFGAYCRLLDRLTDVASWTEPDQLWLLDGQLAQRARINATGAPLSGATMHGLFASRAAAQPGRPALIAPERTLTYGELDALTDLLARALQHRGVGPGEPVAVAMEKGWEQVAAALAVLKAGGAYLPVDPALPARRIALLLEQGEVRVALIQPWLEAVVEWPEGIERLAVGAGQLDDGPVCRLELRQDPDDLAYVIYTSGSTGNPKGVMINHRGAVNTILDLNERFGIGPEDRVLAISAFNFDLSVYDAFGLLAAGGALVFPAAARLYDPSHWADLIARHGVTLWNSVPAFLDMLLAAEAAQPQRRLRSLRLALLSGDWLPLQQPDRLRSMVEGVEVVSLGGATEASIWSILYPIGDVDPAWRSIPYGRPMRNQTFHVLDHALEPRPVWVPGELFIGGVGLALGYWRDGERSAAHFQPQPRTGERLYRTGDLGRWLPDGTIEFLGREDFQVKIRGHRIELGEIEKTLERHPAVDTALVIASGQDRANRRLVAYVVPQSGASRSGGPSPDEKAAALGLVDLGLEGVTFKLSEPGLRRHTAPRGRIAIPAPPLDEALLGRYRARASRREFRREVVPVERLGRLLSALLPVRLGDCEHPDYRYPSPGDRYLVAVYLHVREGKVAGVRGGIYRYCPGAHALQPLALGVELDRRIHVGINYKAFDQSAFTLLLAARPEEAGRGLTARDLALLEAGYIGQLLMESGPEAGLGLCPIGFMDFDRVAPWLGVPPEGVLHGFLVGAVDGTAGVPSPESRAADTRDEAGAVVRFAPPSPGPGWLEPYRRRSSHRQLLPAAVSLERLADLLAALRGIEVREWPLPKYLFPSAGGLYPVQTYVHVKPGRVEGLEEGTYYYHPREHCLVPLVHGSAIGAAIDEGVYAQAAPGMDAPAAFSLFLVGQLDAIRPKYGELSRDYCLLEAGYMGQLLTTTAAGHGLGLHPVPDFDFGHVAPYLALDGTPVLLHTLIGGVAFETAAAVGDLWLDGEDLLAAAPAPVVPSATAEPRPAVFDMGELAGELRRHAESRLPYYMVPHVFMLLETLPLTPNGKIDRQALPVPVEEESLQDVFEEPRTPMETWFRDLWRELLGVERIGIHDRFFTLGGDSVQAVQFLARLRQAGVDLTAREFFEHQTIAALAARARTLDSPPGEGSAAASAVASAREDAFSRAEMTADELAELIEEFGEEDEELDGQV